MGRLCHPSSSRAHYAVTTGLNAPGAEELAPPRQDPEQALGRAALRLRPTGPLPPMVPIVLASYATAHQEQSQNLSQNPARSRRGVTLRQQEQTILYFSWRLEGHGPAYPRLWDSLQCSVPHVLCHRTAGDCEVGSSPRLWRGERRAFPAVCGGVRVRVGDPSLPGCAHVSMPHCWWDITLERIAKNCSRGRPVSP